MNRIFVFLSLAMWVMSGCTRYDNPAPYFEEYEQDGDKIIRQKVLVIAVDGLVGSQIAAYQPANIEAMMRQGKYSFSTKADLNTSEASSWTTLLTGYESEIHHITDQSYLPERDPSHPHGDNEMTPTLFYRLEMLNSRLHTAAIMRNETLTRMLLTDVDHTDVPESDAGVKDAAIEYLDKKDPDVLLVQFTDVLTAGKSGGFVLSNAAYKSALDKVDGYIGEIKTALDKRDENERWLVILTSPHGGTADGTYGSISTDEINVFTLYYNKDLKSGELKADAMTYFNSNGYLPGTYAHYNGAGVRDRTVTEIGVRAQTPSGTASDIFNAASTGEISYEFKHRLNQDNFWAGLSFSGGYTYWYNYFMGKDASSNSAATKGWHLYGSDGAGWSLRFQDGSNTETVGISRGIDGMWRHYVFVFKRLTATTTEIRVYLDGNLSSQQTINMGVDAFANDEPLTLGFNTMDTRMAFPNQDFSDLRVWNKALTTEEAVALGCEKEITDTNPLKANLLAYYGSFAGTSWLNGANTGAPDMILSGTPSIKNAANYSVCPAPADAVYLQNVDIFPQIYYWLGMKVSDDWNVSGSLFLDRFEIEFIK